MLKLPKNLQPLLLILVFLIVLEGAWSGFNLVFSSVSYSTGYQGAKAQYAGIFYNNQRYQNTTFGRFDTTLRFDPDDPETGMCNLEGEMTSVFIPEQSLSNMPDWIPSDWVREAGYIQNPVNTYSWTIENRTYSMEEWRLRWYFSISAEWDEGWKLFEGTEYSDKRYTNTEVWFEFDLTPVWYFEGASTAYFCIAKMQLADVKLHALDNRGDEVKPELETSVSPQSPGSIMSIYYGLFAQQNIADKDAYDYEGKKLNPDLFTSKVYSYFRLANFGTHSWSEFPSWKWKGDVVTVAVDVTVFVIGEWTVQDIEDIDFEDYGRTAKLGGGYSFADWLSSPANRLLLALIAGLAIFIVIALIFPSLMLTIVMLIQSLTGGRRR